ncbi:MAG: glycoside hydrolase family protein, partial [Opitutae bacterium]
LTIGIGRNLEDNGISEAEALYLLKNDIERCTEEVKNTFHWFETAPELVQRGLINMVFNLGLTRLMGFKNMLLALEEGRYSEAAEHALDSRWAEQVGDRAQRIAEQFRQAS